MLKKDRIKTLASPILTGCIVGALVADVCILMFFLLYPWKEDIDFWGWFIISFFCILLPILLLLFSSRRFFSVITIDETGIKRSCFKLFWKLDMLWDGIKEIIYYERLAPFIMFSKSESIQGWDYDDMIKRKDILQIQLTAKVYSVLMQYVQQPIVGLTDEVVAKLKLNK